MSWITDTGPVDTAPVRKLHRTTCSMHDGCGKTVEWDTRFLKWPEEKMQHHEGCQVYKRHLWMESIEDRMAKGLQPYDILGCPSSKKPKSEQEIS